MSPARHRAFWWRLGALDLAALIADPPRHGAQVFEQGQCVGRIAVNGTAGPALQPSLVIDIAGPPVR